jgi:hypothetical protein
VPSRLSITTVRVRTPRSAKRPEAESVAGLKGMFSSARVSSTIEKASPSKMSIVAMGGSLLSQRTMMPAAASAAWAAAIAASPGAPAKTRSWRLTMAGPRTSATAGASPADGVGLAPEHGDGGLGAVGRVGIVGGVLAAHGDPAEHGAGFERAGGDGDGLAAVVGGGLPDEEAAGVAAFGERGHLSILSA